MKVTIISGILIFAVMACKDPKKEQTKNQHIDTIDSIEQIDIDKKVSKAIQNTEKRYVSDSEVDMYDPYDFALEVDTIKAILGKDIAIEIDYFEGDYSGDRDAFIKITWKDTEIKFYEDKQGLHFSNITTPKLSVLGGIRIGIPKQEFLKAMQIEDPDAVLASTVVFTDDYGAMEFFFENDILSLIKIYYEEGD